MGKFLQAVGGLVFLVLVVAYFIGAVVPTLLPDDNGKTRTAMLTPEQTAQLKELLKQPDAEAEFVKAVVDGQLAFNGTTDDFRRGATRPARKQAICSLALSRNPVAQDWIGRVSTRTTNSDGKGVLGVTLAPNVAATTWNNDLSDIGSKTLIEPGNPMFEAMGAVQKGDWVRFSGRFFTATSDCLTEKSMTLRGSMTDPDFLFSFERLEAIPLAN